MRCESWSDFYLFSNPVHGESTGAGTFGSHKTYDPSGRFDSGITRSRVRGSTAIPAAVFSGLRGGLDMGYMSNEDADTVAEIGKDLNGGVTNNLFHV